MSKTGTSKLALSRASNPPYVEADGDPQKDFRPHNKALQRTHGDGAALAAMTNHRRCDDIIVRPFSSADASALYATVRNSIASLSSMFSWCHPDYTITEAETRVAHCIDAWERKIEFPFGIFSTNGPELFGCVGLNQINETLRSANLGYWVGEAYRCRGIAARAASLVASIGFEELSFVRLEIVTLPQNLASQRVAEKVGATRETEARNRLILQGRPTAAVVYSLVPEDMAANTYEVDAGKRGDRRRRAGCWAARVKANVEAVGKL